MFKSLLPFVLAALVLDGAAHPVLDVPTALSVPMMPNAISHGAALPIPLRRQEQGDEEEEDEANSMSKRPPHRKPRPSNDDKQRSNTTLPIVHVPRSTNSTSSTNATLPMHVVPRGSSSHNSTMPINLPRSSKNSTTSSLPVHVVPRNNSTMPFQNSTMPLHVAQKNGTTHLHASRSQPSSSSSGTNSTKPAAPVHIDVGPRSSTHSPVDTVLPHHLRRRATLETHVPAEKVTHLLSGHHRRQGGDNDEYSDTKDTPSDTKPATPIIVPRHSTGVAVADTVLHSGPHMARQSQDDDVQSDC